MQVIMLREHRTLQTQPALILEELVHIFLQCVPDGCRTVFMEQIYQPTLQHSKRNQGGDFMIDYWKSQNSGKLGIVHLIQISCAFCIEAVAARRDVNLTRAYLMDAQLYLGMAKAGMATQSQVEQRKQGIVKVALTKNAQNNALRGADPWQRTRAEAERLIRELADGGMRWSSRIEAARAVAAQVQDFLATVAPHKRFQGARQRDEKIASWLGKMPEAALWFTSKHT